MSPVVLPEKPCKSLRPLIFDAKLRVSQSSTVFACPIAPRVQVRTAVEQCACSRKRRAFMKRRGFHLVVAVLAACLLASTHAFAQGGGASTTGSINGKVADSSGGVLPGVTVSATRPPPMGVP